MMETSGLMFPKPKVKKHRTETVKESTYQEVYKRDEGKCRLCGRKDNLQLHHINGRGKGLTNNVKNCVMLCHKEFSKNKCHGVVHSNNKYWRKKLNQIIATIYEEI